MTHNNKLILTLITVLAANYAAFSQTCPLLAEGSKITLNAQSWTNPLASDAKYLKAKEEQKAELLMAYNLGVASGKTPAASNYPFVYTVKKSSLPDASVEYQMITNIGGKDYSSYIICRNDSLFISRNRGILTLPDDKGGIMAYSIQGVQRIPMKLKVGDQLPVYDDLIITPPATTDITVKKQVFAGYQTNTSNESGFFTDSRTGESGVGAYTKTTTKAIYSTIDVAVRQTLSSSGLIKHYMFAEVTGEEDITLSGKTYKAYVIQSQTWNKLTMNISYDSADEEVSREQQRLSDKMYKNYDKMMVKKQFTNELGYMVSYLKEWFVPELGCMYKTESYDANGGIIGGMTLTAFE